MTNKEFFMKKVLFTLLVIITIINAKDEILPTSTIGYSMTPFKVSGTLDAYLNDKHNDVTDTTKNLYTFSDLNTNTNFGYLRGIDFAGGVGSALATFTLATDNFSQTYLWMNFSFDLHIIKTSFLELAIQPSAGFGQFSTSYSLYTDLYDAGSNHTYKLDDVTLDKNYDIVASSIGFGWGVVAKTVINFTKSFGIYAQYGYTAKYFSKPSIKYNKSTTSSDSEDITSTIGAGTDITDTQGITDASDSAIDPFSNTVIDASGTTLAFGMIFNIATK